jgi:predicted MFS family arabinose efflux permease
VGGALFVLPFALLAVRDRPGAGAAGAAEVAAGAEDSRRDLDVWAALRTRSFWVIALTLFAIFFFLVTVLEHLVLYLVDAGMQRSAATGFYSNMIAMGLISKVAFGLIADRLRAKTALVIDFALLTASSLVLPFATEGALLWVFVIGFGFAYAARDVVTPLIVADCFGVKYLAQIYGALMVTLLPAGTLGPIFAALVHDRTGSYDAAFATFAAVNGLSLAAIGLLRDERRPH